MKHSFRISAVDKNIHDVTHTLSIIKGVVTYRCVRENLDNPEKTNTRYREVLYSKQSFEVIKKYFIGEETHLLFDTKKYKIKVNIDKDSILLSNNGEMPILLHKCGLVTKCTMTSDNGGLIIKMPIKKDNMTKSKWFGIRKKRMLVYRSLH